MCQNDIIHTQVFPGAIQIYTVPYNYLHEATVFPVTLSDEGHNLLYCYINKSSLPFTSHSCSLQCLLSFTQVKCTVVASFPN